MKTWYTFIVTDLADRAKRVIHLNIKRGKFQETILAKILLKNQIISFTFKGKIKKLTWMHEK